MPAGDDGKVPQDGRQVRINRVLVLKKGATIIRNNVDLDLLSNNMRSSLITGYTRDACDPG